MKMAGRSWVAWLNEAKIMFSEAGLKKGESDGAGRNKGS